MIKICTLTFRVEIEARNENMATVNADLVNSVKAVITLKDNALMSMDEIPEDLRQRITESMIGESDRNIDSEKAQMFSSNMVSFGDSNGFCDENRF